MIIFIKMFYVYILFSEKLKRYYVGYSQNPQHRLDTRHNQQKVNATKNGIPYRLAAMKSFNTEIEAIREEKRIKKMKSRVYTEKLIEEWKSK